MVGHYQYYGISGNMRLLSRFYGFMVRLAMKSLNRRSQKHSVSGEGSGMYLKYYPLPKPRIVHDLYTLWPAR